MLTATPETRDNLIESHLEFARNLASRLALRLPRRVDVQELECDAYLGLLKAAETFEPERGACFRTHAAPRINGAMLDGLRERQQPLKRALHKPIRSLSERIADPLDPALTLEACIADDQPPVGYAMELREEAEHAMRGWAPRLCRVMIECGLHGLELKQVARKLGVHVSTVSERLKIARGLAKVMRQRRGERRGERKDDRG